MFINPWLCYEQMLSSSLKKEKKKSKKGPSDLMYLQSITNGKLENSFVQRAVCYKMFKMNVWITNDIIMYTVASSNSSKKGLQSYSHTTAKVLAWFLNTFTTKLFSWLGIPATTF